MPWHLTGKTGASSVDTQALVVEVRKNLDSAPKYVVGFESIVHLLRGDVRDTLIVFPTSSAKAFWPEGRGQRGGVSAAGSEKKGASMCFAQRERALQRKRKNDR